MSKEKSFLESKKLENKMSVVHNGNIRIFSLDELLREFDMFTEEKPVLKVGKWYAIRGINNSNHLYLGDHTGKGFAMDGEWTDFVAMNSAGLYTLSDMKEVEKLLIKEAEKRGFKEGVVFNGLSFESEMTYGSCIMKDSVLDDINLKGIQVRTPEHTWDRTCSNPFIFSMITGKWAETIEEKKPLYVNQYGTEFFEGDRVWHINKRDKSLQFGHTNTFGDLKDNAFFYEIMTERECHQYLADNWDKLHK